MNDANGTEHTHFTAVWGR